MYSLRYIEQNPVRAKGMVKDAWDYRWSSAKAHIGEPDSSGLLDLAWWKRIQDPVEWKQILTEGLPKQQSEELLLHVSTGRPLGSDSFLSKLETRMNRRLRPLPVGRPRKDK